MQSLEWFWPSAERLKEVQLLNAMRQSTAVAMAVHQRMTIHRRAWDSAIGTPDHTVVHEETVLNRLLEDAPDGVKVVLVEGGAGTGKSHLVQWITIQLLESRDADKFVVLPVEKGSRLRDIVNLLCKREELQGETHRELREKLLRAQQPIAPAKAAGRLCEELALVCERMHAEAQQKRSQSDFAELTESEKAVLTWGSANMLPYILRHPEMRPQWTGEGGPIPRVIGNLDNQANQANPRDIPLFEPLDLRFELPENMEGELRNCLARLERGEAMRTAAAATLNQALDEAKGVLLGLHSGDVLDVFQSIRATLSTQNKELIILIEDFADLSGLQKEILQACIMDTAQDETRTLCTIRSVIAYTDNYLQEHSVKSRAQVVFYVAKEFAKAGHDDHATILDKTVELIARYLHAARVGKVALQEAYSNHSHRLSSRAWIPQEPDLSLDEREIEIWHNLEHVEGIHLFPFNRSVIYTLLRERYGENLAFNPRDIIMDLMSQVLRHRRDFFEGTFPSEAFPKPRSIQWDSDRDTWLIRTGATGRDRERVERFLLWWGCDHSTALTFGLPVSKNATIPPTIPPPIPPPVPDPPSPEARAPQFGSIEVRNHIENWRAGTPIVQTNLKRTWRNQMGIAIECSIPWAWIPRRRPTGNDLNRWKGWAHSINVAGIGPDATALPMPPLIKEKDWRDPARGLRLSMELLAVVEEPPGESWNFQGVEQHLAAHMSFVERHRQVVQAWMQTVWYSRTWDALPWLLSALACSAGAFGTASPKMACSAGAFGTASPKKRKDLNAFLDYIFSQPSELGPNDSDPYAAELREWKNNREQIQKMLEHEIGAFQRTGDTLHAMDVTRLIAHLPTERLSDAPDLQIEAPLRAKADLPEAIKFPSDRLRTTCAKKELLQRKEAIRHVQDLLGQEPQVDELHKAIETFRTAGIQTTNLDATDDRRLNAALANLRRLPVAGIIDGSKKLNEESPSNWQAMVALGKHQAHAKPLAHLKQALEDIREIVDRVEKRNASQSTANPLIPAISTHERNLSDIARLLGIEESIPAGQEQS